MQYQRGRVKWFDRRDQEGIVTDAWGNEYYFNASSAPNADFMADMADGIQVLFQAGMAGDVPVVTKFE